MYLHEFAVIYYAPDYLCHVIGRISVVWNDMQKFIIAARRVVESIVARRVFHVVLRQEAQQTPDFAKAGFF